MRYKSYTKISVSTLFLITFISFLINWKYFDFEKIEGDLTRIGMHSEANYGNHGVEFFFSPALSNIGLIENIDTYDIIIVGDSFSNHRFSSAWHNYLRQDSGLKVGVFKIGDLDKIQKSSQYKKSPPKILIYESVERELYNRFNNQNLDSNCTVNHSDLSRTVLRWESMNVTPHQTRRDVSFSFKVDLALKFLRDRMRSDAEKKTTILNLTTPNLFTNKNSNQLLVYSEDIKTKKSISASDWRKIECGLIGLQNKIQENNKTKFIALIAPDKLSVYSPYLVDKTWENMSYYSHFSKDNKLNLVPLFKRFNEALRRGDKDIYLPNDTHWGSAGHQLVGRAVLDYLKDISITDY